MNRKYRKPRRASDGDLDFRAQFTDDAHLQRSPPNDDDNDDARTPPPLRNGAGHLSHVSSPDVQPYPHQPQDYFRTPPPHRAARTESDAQFGLLASKWQNIFIEGSNHPVTYKQYIRCRTERKQGVAVETERDRERERESERILMYATIPPAHFRFVHPAVADSAFRSFRFGLRDRDLGSDSALIDASPQYSLARNGYCGIENSIAEDWLIVLVMFLFYLYPSLSARLCDKHNPYNCHLADCWTCEFAFLIFNLSETFRASSGLPSRIGVFADAFLQALSKWQIIKMPEIHLPEFDIGHRLPSLSGVPKQNNQRFHLITQTAVNNFFLKSMILGIANITNFIKAHKFMVTNLNGRVLPKLCVHVQTRLYCVKCQSNVSKEQLTTQCEIPAIKLEYNGKNSFYEILNYSMRPPTSLMCKTCRARFSSEVMVTELPTVLPIHCNSGDDEGLPRFSDVSKEKAKICKFENSYFFWKRRETHTDSTIMKLDEMNCRHLMSSQIPEIQTPEPPPRLTFYRDIFGGVCVADETGVLEPDRVRNLEEDLMGCYVLTGIVLQINYRWEPGVINYLLQVRQSVSHHRFQADDQEEEMINNPPLGGHLVLLIKKWADDKLSDRWIVLNSCVTTELDDCEARNFCASWKYPVTLVYLEENSGSRKSGCKAELRQLSANVKPDVLFSGCDYLGRSLQPNFIPLTAGELAALSEGNFRVSMDAEHCVDSVAQRHGQRYAHPILKAGRVSIIRGQEPNEGRAFIDHFVVSEKEPADYLTEWSGLMSGDLDVRQSTKWLSSHKEIQRVLWYLKERHCLFIGHDLRNDVRILNFYIPANQLIDTVELYRRNGRSRFLSLKYLAFHILHRNVQIRIHDSVEDAKTSLDLYKHYISILIQYGDTEFHKLLDSLYSFGYTTSFSLG